MRLQVRKVYRDSWAAFIQAWPRLLVLSLLIEIPVFVIQLVAHSEGVPRLLTVRISEDLTVFDLGYQVLIMWFYASLGHHLLVGVLERMVGAERDGHEVPGLWHIVRHLPWGKLIVADVILAVATTIGFILIVPGVLLAVWFALVPVILSYQRCSVRESFRISRSMVRGVFWPMLGIVALAQVVSNLVGEAVGGVIGLFLHSEWSEALAHTLPAALLAPVFALPVVVAFFDLRAQGADAEAQPAA